MKKLSVFLVIIPLLFGGIVPSVRAQTGSDVQSLLGQVQALLQQIRDLQDQINALQAQQLGLKQELRQAIQLTRSLVRGMTGEDVEALQELLASDPELYPEGLVTGFFGPLTEAAVTRLQAKFGIDQVGVVGPITRATINKIFSKLNKGKGSLNRGPGNIFDELELDDDDTDVDLSQFLPGTKGIKVCHIPPGNPANAHTIAIGGPAVQAHLNHGDELGSCGDDEDEDGDKDGNGEEPKDTTAPIISSVSATSTASTSASVSWATNEQADSKVWYDTVSGFAIASTTPQASDSSLVTSHEVTLSNLTPASVYYYIVVSKDAAGNAATSSENSVETTNSE